MDVEPGADAHPHVQVGDLGQAGVVQTHGVVNLAPNEHRGVTQGVTLVKEVPEPLVARPVVGMKDGVVFVAGVKKRVALLVDERGPAKHGTYLWVLLQKFQLALQFAGKKEVVRVKHGDQAAARSRNGIVQGCAGTPVLGEYLERNARITQGCNLLRGAVGGAIVGNDDFKCLHLLHQHAF